MKGFVRELRNDSLRIRTINCLPREMSHRTVSLVMNELANGFEENFQVG